MSLQEDNTIDGKIFKEGELTATAAYIRSMQHKTNWYYEPENNQKFVIVSTYKNISSLSRFFISYRCGRHTNNFLKQKTKNNKEISNMYH